MSSLVKTILIIVAVILVLTPLTLFYVFKVSPISWRLHEPFNTRSGLALKGYDPVAYFNDDLAEKGDSTKGLKYYGNIMYFSSDENKLTFKTFPERFQPQYGGYCATAVASGFTADANPEIWHIEDGKLYLFFNEDAKNDFIANIDNGIIERANAKWLQQ